MDGTDTYVRYTTPNSSHRLVRSSWHPPPMAHPDPETQMMLHFNLPTRTFSQHFREIKAIESSGPSSH
jgi:hypothetical protein